MIALTVLKWIGIVLGALIGLLLVLLLIVLFVPLRYELWAHVPDTVLTEEGAFATLKETSRGRVRFHWLLHAVRGGLSYPEDTAFRVKLLCFTLMGKEEEEDGQRKEEKKPEKKKKAEKAQEKKPEKKSEKKSEKEKQPEPQPEKRTEPEKDTQPEKKTEPEKDTQPERRSAPAAGKAAQKKTVSAPEKPARKEKAEEEADDRSFLEKLTDLISAILHKPYEVVEKIWYTISSVCDKIEKVRELLESETFARAKEAVLKQGKRVLKTVLPRKSDVRILYGTGDPYLTAQILAAYSVLYPVLGAFCRVSADFEQRIIGADVLLKGRITLFRLLWSGLMLYFNKDIRRIRARIEKIRGKEDESEPVQ